MLAGQAGLVRKQERVTVVSFGFYPSIYNLPFKLHTRQVLIKVCEIQDLWAYKYNVTGTKAGYGHFYPTRKPGRIPFRKTSLARSEMSYKAVFWKEMSAPRDFQMKRLTL
jgi:hypothetical protein